MPKIKTNRAAAKRFRKTASGKYKCGHANKSHILTKKATKRKRNLRQDEPCSCRGRGPSGPHASVSLRRAEQWHESSVVLRRAAVTRKS